MTSVAVKYAILGILASGEFDSVRGRMSVYWPGDNCNTGTVLACDTPRRRRLYRPGSVHVALREWYRIGCGIEVVVCAEQTGACEVAPVLDSGPWGIIRGPLRRAKAEGRWRRARSTKEASRWFRQLPTGWRFRGVVDLSRELWRRLGRPRDLSFVRIFVPRRRR